MLFVPMDAPEFVSRGDPRDHILSFLVSLMKKNKKKREIFGQNSRALPHQLISLQCKRKTGPCLQASSLCSHLHLLALMFPSSSPQYFLCHLTSQSLPPFSLLRYPCPDFRRDGSCPRGDDCNLAHGIFEYHSTLQEDNDYLGLRLPATSGGFRRPPTSKYQLALFISMKTQMKGQPQAQDNTQVETCTQESVVNSNSLPHVVSMPTYSNTIASNSISGFEAVHEC